MPRKFDSEDREAMRRRLLANVFTKTNRILTGDRKVRVNFVNSNTAVKYAGAVAQNVPGFTIYPDIYLNQTKFLNLGSKRELVALLGLNYHELSHILFTSREYPGHHLTAQYQQAWMVLEDQRIESLFTALYEPAGKYFTENAIKFLLDHEQAWETAFLWCYGRTYIPLEIRKELEARFVHPNKVQEAKALIDEYKAFSASDFDDYPTRVTKVLREFQLLLESLPKNANVPDQCNATAGVQGKPDPNLERQAQDSEQKRRRVEEETGEDQSGFWEDDDEDSEDESADGSGGETSEGDSDDDSAGGGTSSDNSDDSEDEGTGSGNGEGEDGDLDQNDSEDSESEVTSAGQQSGNSAAISEFDDDELFEYLEELVDAVREDSNVNEELDRLSGAMNERGNIDVIDFGMERSKDHPVDASITSEVRNLEQHFRRLYADVEPGWKYGSDVGRLNVQRAMNNPEDYDEHFDEWDEGREHETGLEVFISLDMSGSMQQNQAIVAASKAMWELKRALDSVDAKVTVVGFHSTTVGLYDRNSKANRSNWPLWVGLGGATHPAESMHLGRRVLAESNMPNKLFVIITDGQWAAVDNLGGEMTHLSDYSELLASIPATKMYIGVNGGGRANRGYTNSFDTWTDLANPNALVELVKDTITVMLKNRSK